MRRVWPCVVLLALVGCGSWNENQYRDFAWCSDEGTCPPGQECTTWGVCMRTCTPCASGDCGCAQGEDGYNQGVMYTCRDGYCQQACQGGSQDAGFGPGPACYGSNQACDPDTMICRASCGSFGPENGCPTGSSCAQPPEGGPGYCKPHGRDGGVLRDGGVGDGGVGDGGVGDGAADGPTAYQPLWRHSAAAVLGHDGRIYVAGGLADTQETDRFEALTPASCTWEQLQPLPAARVEPVLAVADTGDLYALGGSRGGQPVGDVTRYRVTSDTWDVLPAAEANGHARGLAAFDGLIYLFGGLRDNGSYTDAVSAYDPAIGDWVSGRAHMPDQRLRFAVAPYYAQVFVIGGQLDGSDLGSVNLYDPTANQWNPEGPQPSFGLARRSLAAATTHDGAGQVLVVTGGAITGGAAQRTTNVWRGGGWTAGPAMPVARMLHASVGTPDGNVFVFGGQDETGAEVRQVDVYNVNLERWVTCFQ